MKPHRFLIIDISLWSSIAYSWTNYWSLYPQKNKRTRHANIIVQILKSIL